MIKTRIGGYSEKDNINLHPNRTRRPSRPRPPHPAPRISKTLRSGHLAVCGGGRFIRGLAFFFGGVEVDGRG